MASILAAIVQNLKTLALRALPHGRFEQGDAQALPYPAASFDAVLCGYGLMHFPV